MKILFDTNVYISEVLVGGLAERILNTVLNARWKVFVSTYILDEVERVLSDKLGFSARVATMSRVSVRRRAESVDVPASRHQVPGDKKDNAVLQAAVAGGVDYLVTDDRHLLLLHPYEGIRIVSMREFVTVLQQNRLWN